MAKSNQFVVQMQQILDDYSKEVKRVMNNAADKVAKESLRKLRSDSPKKTGDYAKGWTIKRERGASGVNTLIIHNKTDYQLAHLLERPHEIVNRDHQGRIRSYGSTGPGHGQKVHIEPVERWANEELPLEIERELE